MSSELTWRKSSYSGSAGGECVEVAVGPGTAHVHIRDSKRTAGPRLSVLPATWSAFLRHAASAE
ncbi:DUF397 domain-containing protein [Streptomyces sp. YGL11-2]|uniref:DUF397 domain-containing protein n=1 Tax=Streptomyces sp. YGL11-2 TaxID=3414028 RepID=UPI003CF8B75A